MKPMTKREICNKQSENRRSAQRALTGFIPDLTAIIDNVLYNERWLDIEGYNGVYKISDFGRVKSFFAPVNKIYGKIIKPLYTAKGYQYVGLSKNKVSKNHYIHRLVAIHFIPNPENKPEVNHIGKDENGKISKRENRFIFIEWATKSENELHKNRNRIGIQGTQHPFARLNEKDIYYIRRSKKTAKILAEMLKVNIQTIYDIRKFKKWKHLLTNKI